MVRRMDRSTATTTLITAAMTTAATKVVATPWSNMACAWAAGVPASVMRRSNVDLATTSTPTAITPMATTATPTETTVMRIARPRGDGNRGTTQATVR